VPVEFQPAWQTLTKAYYTAKDLDALNQVHGPLFEAVHTERLTDSSPNALRAFFESRGIKGADFDATFNSFDVNRKQKWAVDISRAYRITAIPVVIVQGPAGTFVTSVRMAGTETNMLKVLDHLVKMELAAPNKKAG
jgi:thiol:disulfide interchange protein DsbA